MRKIAICDDSKLDRQLLKVVIQIYFENNEEEFKIFEYELGDNLLDDIEVELLFLDIIMNGMKIARKLRDIQFKAPIIFLTAHADYAVESYEVYVAGYLLKPYDTNKLTLLLDEVLQRSVQKRIAVKVKKQHRYLEINDIMYAKSDKHVLNIHLKDSRVIQTTEKLSELKKRLIQKDLFVVTKVILLIWII